MFDMWSSVTSKLEAHSQIQTNIQTTTSLQNSSSGSIKGKGFLLNKSFNQEPDPMVINNTHIHKIEKGILCANELQKILEFFNVHLWYSPTTQPWSFIMRLTVICRKQKPPLVDAKKEGLSAHTQLLL